MKLQAQEVLGVGIVAFLLWWIWKHKSGNTIINRPGSTFSVPPLPPGSIYNFPPAPDLHQFKLTGPNVPTRLQDNTPPDKSVVNPAPCSCGCENNSASNMITQAITAFTSDLQNKMGATFDTYLKNIVAAVPIQFQQFINNDAAKNASTVLKYQAAQMSVAAIHPLKDLGVQVAGVVYPGDSQVYSSYNINQYVQGRQVAFAPIKLPQGGYGSAPAYQVQGVG